MKTLELKPKKLEFSKFKQRTALESDAKQIIDYDCMVTENGQPIILYAKLDFNTDDLRWAMKRVNFQRSDRTGGLKTNSAIFGYSPKVALRKDFCSATSMATKQPKEHFIITNFAHKLSKVYEKYFPDTFAEHKKVTQDKILDQWVIPGTPFTSGIVNKDNPLKYHHDSGNFKGVLSNMIAFKRGMEGGRLACPEYDIKFEIQDNTVVIFDGQSILHGVTPFKKTSPDGYRLTAVYYSLEQMWKCDDVNKELLRIRQVKREREMKRL